MNLDRIINLHGSAERLACSSSSTVNTFLDRS